MAVLLLAAGGCPARDDLCGQAVAHMMSVIAGPPDGPLGAAERAVMTTVRALSEETCRGEGLSREQADCILAVRTVEQMMALGECPAIRAKKPSWLQLPAGAGDRDALAERLRPPDARRESALRFRALAGSGGGTCGLGDDGALQCWGAWAKVPEGSFVKIGWGVHLCGLEASGRLVCVSDTRGDDLSYLPTEPLHDFAEGRFHGCGVRRSDGSLTCWSQSAGKAVTPPAGRFTAVVSGLDYSCALAEDHSARCFGSGASTSAPEGTFRALSGGLSGACGLREDGTLRCWDERAFARAPSGVFKAVSCGNWHCCAIRDDDTLACWGNDEDGRASPPAGKFSVVMASVEHSCGVRAEGGVVCWGSNHLGQGNVPQRAGEHNWFVPGF